MVEVLQTLLNVEVDTVDAVAIKAVIDFMMCRKGIRILKQWAEAIEKRSLRKRVWKPV